MSETLAPPRANGAGLPAGFPAFVPSGITVQPGAERLTDRAVILCLSISAWGVDRGLKSDQYQVDANKAMTRAGKKILVSPELAAVYGRDSACRDWVASRSLPSTLRRGTYLQPVANILEVDGYLTRYAAEREDLVSAFLAAYPRRVEEARTELRSLFDPGNYPPVSRLAGHFRTGHGYVELASAPGGLRAISSELFRREQRKVERQWAEALDEARALLRAQLSGLVDHMVDRLTPGPDGSPRVFRRTLVEGMDDWLSTFSARNITDDRELADLVGRARALLRPDRGGAVTAEALRGDAGLRDHLRGSFSAIKEQVDALVTLSPSRRIWLED